MTGSGAHLHLVEPEVGPRVVALGGGHGLAATLRAVRSYARDITAIVSVADDGGSTGRLRADVERPAPGDLRKSLVALSDETSLLARTMEHRFDSGELKGHAVGNLVLLGLAEAGGSLVAALDEMVRILGAEGRVLPATSDVVQLCGLRRSGDTVEGQVEVSSHPDLTRVSLKPPGVSPCAEAVLAIAGAEQIVLGPGSLYTSVLAATAVPGIVEAIAAAEAQVVYVCNLHPQVPETEGYDVGDHVAALERHGLSPDVVIYDPDTSVGSGEMPSAIAFNLAKPSGLAHDPQLLGEALRTVFR